MLSRGVEKMGSMEQRRAGHRRGTGWAASQSKPLHPLRGEVVATRHQEAIKISPRLGRRSSKQGLFGKVMAAQHRVVEIVAGRHQAGEVVVGRHPAGEVVAGEYQAGDVVAGGVMAGRQQAGGEIRPPTLHWQQQRNNSLGEGSETWELQTCWWTASSSCKQVATGRTSSQLTAMRKRWDTSSSKFD
jgi:hypothetical protein